MQYCEDWFATGLVEPFVFNFKGKITNTDSVIFVLQILG